MLSNFSDLPQYTEVGKLFDWGLNSTIHIISMIFVDIFVKRYIQIKSFGGKNVLEGDKAIFKAS